MNAIKNALVTTVYLAIVTAVCFALAAYAFSAWLGVLVTVTF